MENAKIIPILSNCFSPGYRILKEIFAVPGYIIKFFKVKKYFVAKKNIKKLYKPCKMCLLFFSYYFSSDYDFLKSYQMF